MDERKKAEEESILPGQRGCYPDSLCSLNFNGAFVQQRAVTNCELANHERTLTTDVVLAFHAEAKQLHGGSSSFGEYNASRIRHVNAVVSRDSSVRAVINAPRESIRFNNVNTTDHAELALAVRTVAANIAVQDES
jgi:hypothetical protein